MPVYDLRCNLCGRVKVDVLQPIEAPLEDCRLKTLYEGELMGVCEGKMERVWLQSAPGVIPDDIPGGMEIKHGICHDDGTPRKFYSKSEMAKAAKEKGYVNHVTHIGSKGSDKSKH